MKKIIFVLSVIAIILGIATYANRSTPQKIEIVRILDGDTIETTTSKIRLSGIDCYETSNRQRAYKQAYENNLTMEQVIENGKKSKESLTNLLNAHKGNIYFVENKSPTPDKYNRKLGIVYATKINVNEYMLNQGGCLKYNYTPTSKETPSKQSTMSFIIWFGIFAILAWYQQEHLNKYKGNSKSFNGLLLSYCLLNIVFLCVAIYRGFNMLNGWFVLPLILSPLAIKYLLLKIEMLFYKLHYFKRFSIVGLLLIPMSIYQMNGNLWYIIYLLALSAYCAPKLITKIKNRN